MPFVPNAVAGTETPTEVLLYGRNRFDNGAHALLGGAVAVSPGASAAFFRVFVGGGFGLRVTREKLEILDKVYFEFDGDKIDPRSGALLDEVANTLRNHPEVLLVEFGGHTDSKGNDKYNVDLSQRRVNSVRSYLVGKGVPEGRLVAKGYGETRPIANNKTADGRAQNRRVEFLILQNAEGADVEVKTIDTATQKDKDKAGVKEENRPDASKIDKD